MARLSMRVLRSRAGLVWLVTAGLLGTSVFASRYWATGGFSFLSRYSDLAWLRATSGVLGELPSDQFLLPNLFVYAMAFVKGFVKDAFVALEVTSFLFHLTLVGAVYFVAVSLVRSWKAGILAGVFLALYPWMVAVLRMSAYSVIAGLAWLTLALYVSIAFSSDQASVCLVLAALSVLTAISDPYVGLILVVTLILGAVIRVREESLLRVLAAPLASLPGGLVSVVLLFYKPGLALPNVMLNPTVLVLTLPATFFGGLLLYTRRDLKGLRWLMSWLIASVVVPLSLNVSLLTFVCVFILPPLLILASALVFNVDRGMVRVMKDAASSVQSKSEGEEAEWMVELDVGKLFSAILLAVLALSSLAGSYGVYAEVNSAYRLEWERYGDMELREALSWISANTPRPVVVAAEDPLGDWVEAVAGRVSLSNRPVDFRSDLGGFHRSYAAESILNANYEIRNAFLRLRDWGPVAPQRVPFFAVSDGERFLNFLYVDESHAQVTYVMGGNSFTPSFYDYSVRFSGWVERSSDPVALCHVFEVEGALINKTIRLAKGAAEASVQYVIEAKPGASLRGFSLKAWVPWERLLGYTRVLGSRVELSLDVGDFLIVFEGDAHSVDFGPDRVWAQQRVEARFTPSKNKVYAKMTVKALAAKPIAWNGGRDDVVAYATRELMAQYHVAYLVVPTIVKRQGMDLFGLGFPTFVSMFENSKLTVYKVIISS